MTLVTPHALQCCHIFLGYLVTDLVALLLYGNQWKGTGIYLVHHITGLWTWGLLATQGHCLGVAVSFLLCETTAPFTNGRWFLSTLGYSSGPTYAINGILMFFSFLAFRILLMGGLFVKYMWLLRAPLFALPVSTYLTCIFSFCIGYPMQLFWFRKIAVGLLKVLQAGSKGSAVKLGKD